MGDNIKKEDLIERLVSNLPALRAKMKISQAELAEVVGIGRQTLVSIESKKSKMRWDTFLAMMLVISRNNDASELMSLLGLQLQDISVIIEDGLLERRSSPLQDKIWTDSNYSGDCTIRGIVPVPVGYLEGKCPKCQSKNIRGAIIMPSADEQAPNLICLDCGYWWD